MRGRRLDRHLSSSAMKHATILCLATLSLLGCSSATSNSNPAAPQAGATGTETPTGGSSGAEASGGTGATTGPVARSACGLPLGGASGVPQPSGAAENLQVLDWAGFQAAVSYTFDDANSSQIDHYGELQALGVPMTFYLQTGKNEAGDEIWAQALQDGHELGNHTENHEHEATGADIDAATEFIEQHFGVTPYTMAAPYGDSSYVEFAETRFLINRGVAGGTVAPKSGTNPFNLPCYIPDEDASANDLNSIVDQAHSRGRWQILLVHGFTGGHDYAYQPVGVDQFVAHVQHTKSLEGMWVDSVVRVGAYWIAQKLVSELTPTASDGATTWSWTLPDHFPPGMCLRVTTEGGTLVQNDQPVPWDEHGYYEIALDAGSMSLE